MKNILFAVVAMALVGFLFVPTVNAASYLKIEGIDGESKDESTPPGSTVAPSQTRVLVPASTNEEGGSSSSDANSGTETTDDGSLPKVPHPIRVLDSEVSESGEKGGTEDINIGVGELNEASDDSHKDWIDILSASAAEVRGWDLETKEEIIGRLSEEGVISVSDAPGTELEDIGAPQASASKPKEIVVVGSNARAVDSLLQFLTDDGESEARVTPDSFFDIDVGFGDETAGLHAVAVAQSDENIRNIMLSDREVVVDYQTTVRLFGFIPLSATSRTTVSLEEGDENGRVKVRFPWWSIFGQSLVNRADLENTLEEELQKDGPQNNNQSDLEFLQSRAQTLQTISNISKAAHDVAMNSIRNLR